MEMQDNEFDDLFRSKLDGFEMEPSANVWQGVTTGLQSRKHKKVLVPFLSIAASIIVLVSAGILFLPQKGRVIVKHNASTMAGKTHPAANPVAQANNNSLNETPAEIKASKPVSHLASNNNAETAVVVPVENTIATNNQETPVKPVEQPVVASVSSKPDNKDVVVPGKETNLVPKQQIEETTGFTTKPVLVADQLPVQNKPEISPSVKPRNKIRTLGDLINVVVAKVDKRKDKVIEFSNKNDEDESTITGVNLGIIKFKKEQ